jgi:hypothetical protein
MFVFALCVACAHTHTQHTKSTNANKTHTELYSAIIIASINKKRFLPDRAMLIDREIVCVIRLVTSNIQTHHSGLLIISLKLSVHVLVRFTSQSPHEGATSLGGQFVLVTGSCVEWQTDPVPSSGLTIFFAGATIGVSQVMQRAMGMFGGGAHRTRSLRVMQSLSNNSDCIWSVGRNC